MESKWISVEERLPDNLRDVWVNGRDQRAYLADEDWFPSGVFSEDPIHVTIWAEIEATPPPPPRKMVTKTGC